MSIDTDDPRLKVWVDFKMANNTSVEGLMELHNIDKALIEDGACVQMNHHGDWNIADCGDQNGFICEYVKMSCEQNNDQKSNTFPRRQ